MQVKAEKKWVLLYVTLLGAIGCPQAAYRSPKAAETNFAWDSATFEGLLALKKGLGHVKEYIPGYQAKFISAQKHSPFQNNAHLRKKFCTCT